jgi:hypothetical protein
VHRCPPTWFSLIAGESHTMQPCSGVYVRHLHSEARTATVVGMCHPAESAAAAESALQVSCSPSWLHSQHQSSTIVLKKQWGLLKCISSLNLLLLCAAGAVVWNRGSCVCATDHTGPAGVRL